MLSTYGQKETVILQGVEGNTKNISENVEAVTKMKDDLKAGESHSSGVKFKAFLRNLKRGISPYQQVR